MNLWLAVPSPSPTPGPTPLERFTGSPALWWVLGGLVVLYLVMRAVGRRSE